MSAALAYIDSSANARPLHVLARTQLAPWRASQSPALNASVDAQAVSASPGSLLLLSLIHINIGIIKRATC